MFSIWIINLFVDPGQLSYCLEFQSYCFKVPQDGEKILPDILKKLENKAWTFAKTMPQNPHFWSAKKDWENPEDFLDAVRHIRTHGDSKFFGRTEYIVFYHKGFRYWTMGARLAQTTIINRAVVDKTDPDWAQNWIDDEPEAKPIYDLIAGVYDSRHKETIHFVEEQIILDRITRIAPLGRVLSLGCGTGHDITMCQLEPKGFLGVDISPEMLVVANRNYPEHLFAEWDCREDVEASFDTVIGLFGIVNYVGPERVFEIVRQVGAKQFFFVLYAPPYFPDYLNGEAKHYAASELSAALLDSGYKIKSVEGLSFPVVGGDELPFPELYHAQNLLSSTELSGCKYWIVSGHEA